MKEKRINIKISEEKHQMVKEKAIKERKTITMVVHELLNKWLKK